MKHSNSNTLQEQVPQVVNLGQSDFQFQIKEAPPLVKKILEPLETEDEKLLALYVATVLSGSLMPNTTVNYKNKECYPSLYLAIIMPPGRGKGIISDVAEIISSVNAELLNKSNLLRREYNERLKLYNKNLNKSKTTITEPEKPNFVLLKIAGDITSSRFKEQLAANQGKEFLALVETEMDSFGVNSSGSMFGTNNSTILRSAFEFEPISQMRRANAEYLMCETPKLSVVLGGTESQIAKVIPNNKEGLLSRFLVLLDNSPAEWQNVKPDEKKVPLKKYFKELSPLFHEVWLQQSNGDIKVAFTDTQWELLNNYGKSKLEKIQQEKDENAESIPKRHCNMIVRIASILSLLRALDKIPENRIVVCTESDFNLAMWMADKSYKFALQLYDSLPGKSLSEHISVEGLLQVMNSSFTTQDFHKACFSKNISKRTADRKLKEAVELGLVSNEIRGKYVRS